MGDTSARAQNEHCKHLIFLCGTSDAREELSTDTLFVWAQGYAGEVRQRRDAGAPANRQVEELE